MPDILASLPSRLRLRIEPRHRVALVLLLTLAALAAAGSYVFSLRSDMKTLSVNLAAQKEQIVTLKKTLVEQASKEGAATRQAAISLAAATTEIADLKGGVEAF